MTKLERMRELVEILNQAAKVYYQGKDEIMTNYEYDRQYDELVRLEEETGTVLAGSPTVSVGYETLSELPKEAHISPMLSLNKTKDVSELESFIGSHEGLLSLKLDGLSVIVTYENGELTKALTRGNGEIGEVITNNAKVFENLPHKIPFHGRLVIRGEALIKYSDFKRMNENQFEVAEQYKNPRNLCSGSVRQLNNEITAKRHVNYLVYNLIMTDYDKDFETREEQIKWLVSLGFDVVPYRKVTQKTIAKAVTKFSEEIQTNDFPSDGLVLTFDNIVYSQSLGRTAKFPKDSIAFKWKDELALTTLKEVEWSASRTGLINPVAIFEPVELEGTTVSRASIHNISIMKELALGYGDEISVYKANMIIPQIQENSTQSATVEIPDVCPVCHGKTEILNENGSEVLICTNKNCYAKKIKAFSHFVSRNAMNIDGLSEATIEKIIAKGFLHEFADFYHLKKYRQELSEMEGFGEKSCDNLFQAIENSRQTTLPRLIYSLGIKGIGLSMAKLICRNYSYSLPDMSKLTVDELVQIDGVGEVLAESFVNYFNQAENKEMLCRLWEEVVVEHEEIEKEQPLTGMTFVITGSLENFENRDSCKEKIEKCGGKVTGSVSKNTTYLVNNNVNSTSGKNKKAKELGIPIISEQELLELLNR